MNSRRCVGRSRDRLLIALAAAGTVGLALPGAAVAQGRVKPEIMLLVDTSGSMELRESFDNQADRFPICSGPDATQPELNKGYQQSRINIAKEVIAGSPTPLKDAGGNVVPHWCIEHDAAFRGGQNPQHPNDGYSLGADRNFPHFRPMCCETSNGARCVTWAPCGADHGVDGRASDAASGSAALRADGIVQQELQRIKFGLMTFDTEPRAEVDATGHYSFAHDERDDTLQVPLVIANGVGTGTVNMSGNSARGITRPNAGARNEEAPFGPLVRGNKGLVTVGGNEARDRAIGESADDVEQHNTYVLEKVRAMVPHGFTPIAPLLHDLVSYYDEEKDSDRGYLCRKRVAVLITDGAPTEYYGGQPCNLAVNCGAQGARCVVRNGGRVCIYPKGYPYASPEEYAAQLFQERDIPLFVIGFNVDGAGQDNARAIAELGSPGMGLNEDEPGFFLATDREELRTALRRVSNAALQGLQSRSRPVVVTPGKGDDLGNRDVRQWRLTTYSRVPGSADTGKYGEVDILDYACGDVNGVSLLVEKARTPVSDDLAARQVPRKAVSKSVQNGENLTVLSAQTGAIHADGRAGTVNEGVLRSLLDAAAPGDPALGDPFKLAIDTLDGFSGEESFNEDGTRRHRSMAELLEGDVVAIQAPRLGVRSASYQRFQADHAARPTVIATGAADGLVHFFRAVDGHEVVNFMPRTTWQRVSRGAYAVDGPLTVADVAACRSLGAGRRDCPAEADALTFRTVLAGGVGRGGANLFGLDVTGLTTLAAADQDAQPLFAPQVWPVGQTNTGAWDVTNSEQDYLGYFDGKLGRSVSRPLVTHVRRVNGPDTEIVGAVIVGCGDDPVPATAVVARPDGVGRCVLVLDALTGHLIRKFDNDDGVTGEAPLTFPVTGSPAAWPLAGIAASDRAYIGDRAGQLWRMDLRDGDPANWSMERIWPKSIDPLAAGYPLGKPVVDRPTVALDENGELVVVFGTGDGGNADDRSMVISLSDRAVLDVANGALAFQAKANWKLPLNAGEYLTGSPLVRGKLAFFTTAEPRANDLCVSAQGRLYGVHYTDVLSDNQTFKKGGNDVNVVPSLPKLDENNNRESNALSLLLPPGRLAFGLAITLTPSCIEGGSPTTDIVLNLADEDSGAKGAIQKDATKIEVVNNQRQIAVEDLDGSVFLTTGTNTLSICLDCDRSGRHNAGQSLRVGPFPSVVVSWGSTFTR